MNRHEPLQPLYREQPQLGLEQIPGDWRRRVARRFGVGDDHPAVGQPETGDHPAWSSILIAESERGPAVLERLDEVRSHRHLHRFAVLGNPPAAGEIHVITLTANAPTQPTPVPAGVGWVVAERVGITVGGTLPVFPFDSARVEPGSTTSAPPYSRSSTSGPRVDREELLTLESWRTCRNLPYIERAYGTEPKGLAGRSRREPGQ